MFKKGYKCPCCKNPWSLDHNISSSSSSSSSSFPFVLSCQPCFLSSNGINGINPNHFDNSISLKDNFFQWCTGGWKKSNPIPNEYSQWNSFLELRDLNFERIQNIVNEIGNISDDNNNNNDNNNQENQDLLKLKNFYHAMMDENTIESRGISPIHDILNTCSNFKINPTQTLAILHRKFGINTFFSLYSSPDQMDANFTIANITQSGLGLPDRDYYFDEDKAEIRTKYIQYISKVFQLLGKYGIEKYQDPSTTTTTSSQQQNQDDDDNNSSSTNESISLFYQKIAERVYQLESILAKSHMTRTQKRDPILTYNVFTTSSLDKLCSPPLDWSRYLARGLTSKPTDFTWEKYFKNITQNDIGKINVSTVEAIKTAITTINSYSNEDIILYLVFHTIVKMSPHLPNEFTLAQFEFFEKTLKGTQEIKPRWKRTLEALEEALGDALGKIYVKKYFPIEAKSSALQIVEEVKEALRERLHEVQWMCEETRQEALKKMESFRVKIGYTSSWIDYTNFNVNPSTHLENVFSSREFLNALDLSKINQPTNRETWLMTPQTVNAYYHPYLNEIVFPAAILQPPFFDVNADDPINFGSLGAVVGHEMTHGFDDQGRKYDSVGCLRDWWSGSDGEEYDKRSNVMVRQAEKFVLYDVAVKGKLTCGENTADLGGVKLSLRALKKRLEKDPLLANQFINGFTPIQRFFISWGQIWRDNVKKERALQLITIDPHGPHELRCNGTLSNIQEFFEAFDIQAGDPMYRPEEERVDIW